MGTNQELRGKDSPIPPHILVVEDEEPLLELLRYNLEKAGYVVETIANGDCAEARLKETVADLLVLDWMLPGLSGIELCRRLRQAVATKNLPIIILTGAARNQIACAASKPVPTTTSPSRSR